MTAPVVYDHFSSKRELHRHLLERHFAELRALWIGFERVLGGEAWKP